MIEIVPVAVHIQLRPVAVANRGDLEDIDPGDPQRTWVHANWYWHQRSLDHPEVTFRLVHVPAEDAAVGMVAYGPMYLDESLTQRVTGAYEIMHLVLDAKHQRKGLGAIVGSSATTTKTPCSSTGCHVVPSPSLTTRTAARGAWAPALGRTMRPPSGSRASFEVFDDPEVAKISASRAHEAARRSSSKAAKRPRHPGWSANRPTSCATSSWSSMTGTSVAASDVPLLARHWLPCKRIRTGTAFLWPQFPRTLVRNASPPRWASSLNPRSTMTETRFLPLCEVPPNPSLTWSPNGRPPGPVWRYAVVIASPGVACRWRTLSSNVRTHPVQLHDSLRKHRLIP